MTVLGFFASWIIGSGVLMAAYLILGTMIYTAARIVDNQYEDIMVRYNRATIGMAQIEDPKYRTQGFRIRTISGMDGYDVIQTQGDFARFCSVNPGRVDDGVQEFVDQDMGFFTKYYLIYDIDAGILIAEKKGKKLWK